MEEIRKIESRLWDYLDGIALPDEQKEIEKLISENSTWRQLYQELQDVHQSMLSSELEQPSLRFTKKVMENIALVHIAPATKKYINSKIIWSIAFFFIVLIFGTIIYSFVQIDWSSSTNSSTGMDISKIDFSRIYNANFVTVFMMANVFLGLMFLDHLLTIRKKKLNNQ
jgi:magnesium-transporting ATPase (P-type)